MDPNANLREIRQALKRLDTLSGKGPEWAVERRIETDILRDHVEALDEWLTRGGFLPTAWDHPRGGAL